MNRSVILVYYINDLNVPNIEMNICILLDPQGKTIQLLTIRKKAHTEIL